MASTRPMTAVEVLRGRLTPLKVRDERNPRDGCVLGAVQHARERRQATDDAARGPDLAPPWQARKEAYVAHLATADRSTIRVSLADKLHNARAILADLHTVGDDVWARFNADRQASIWYYDALASTFEERNAGPMAAELRRTVDAIRRSAG
jgi:(p)ppGpp synthase/HD superfamily hydrolase